MSTRSTIAHTERTHLYNECLDNGVYIQIDDPYVVMKLFTDEEWNEIHAQIIQGFCQDLLCNSNIQVEQLPTKVWTYPGAKPLDKELLVACFKKWVEDYLS